MFDNDTLPMQVIPTSEGDIDAAFGTEDSADNAPKNTKDKPNNEKNLDKTKDKSKPSSKEKTDVVKSTNKTLSDFSDEDEKNAFDNEDDDENKKGDDVDPDEDIDPDEDTDPDEGDDEEGQNKDKTKKNKDNKEPEDDAQLVKDFLTQRANLLIKKGVWEDFEDSENFEWTEESFEDMEIQQRNYQKEQLTSEILDSFGPYGRDIADYAAKGGDPDKLIDIFKAQTQVEILSVDSEEAQRAVVLKYETEFLGKKPERVKSYIDSLIVSKELKEAAIEAKEAMETSLADQAEALQNQQSELIKRQKDKQKSDIQSFSTNVSQLISKAEDIPADEKQQLIKVLTKFNKTLPNGTPINEFYEKFAEFKKDLPNYINLVRFVINPDKYIKGIKTSAKNAANEKAFRLARGVSKDKKVKTRDTSHTTDTGKTTKFKLI